MKRTPFSADLLADRHGFILAHETVCHGLSPAETDDKNPFFLYDTRAEAECERVDAAAMRAEAIDDAHMELELEDDGPWVEAAVLHSDGALTLPDHALTFTMDALREFLR